MAGENVLILSEELLNQKFNSLLNEIISLKTMFQSNQQPTSDGLLSEDEVALKLGVCSRTIKNRLTKNREMAYSEIKGKRFVKLSELNRYIERHSIPARR